jgi:hypothetical protein
MKGVPATLVLAMAMAIGVAGTSAQDVANSDNSRTAAFFIKLSAPVYPPVVRLAHIIGDVELTVTLRQDGSLASAVVESGPPLLRLAALTSAQQTQFGCPNGSQATNSFQVVYAFEIEGDCGCEPISDRLQTSSAVPDKEYRVTTIAHTICTCDPVSESRKIRSLKCLYLWRCGSQQIGR